MQTRSKADIYTQTSLDAETAHLNTEMARLGRNEYLRRVKGAARRAVADLPDDGEIKKLDPISRQYVERISNLIETGLRGSDWNDSELAAFANDVAWAKLAADAITIAMDNDGGGGVTPATQCRNEYNQCTRENGCDTSGWICFCCIPCSLQYMKCLAKGVVSIGGFRGISIA